MARKKKQEEHVNHERWLVSYADFITLLFAFFVVMYSISSVNEGKYRVLSDTISSAFDSKGLAIEPIQIGSPAKSLSPLQSGKIAAKPSLTPQSNIRPTHIDSDSVEVDSAGSGSVKEVLDSMTKEVQTEMSSLINPDMINLRRHKGALEIELKSNVLFAAGQAKLSIQAEKILIRLSEALVKFPNSIQVEGHTDDVKTASAQFPSNWELSSARASSVAHLFAEHGMDPEQLSAVGYAEYRPKVDNLSDSLRSQNRRVVLMVRPIALTDKNAKQSGKSVLNNADPDLAAETDAAQLNESTPDMLQDAPISDADDFNILPLPSSDNNAAEQETTEIENITPLISPIQLPFSTGLPENGGAQ